MTKAHLVVAFFSLSRSVCVQIRVLVCARASACVCVCACMHVHMSGLGGLQYVGMFDFFFFFVCDTMLSCDPHTKEANSAQQTRDTTTDKGHNSIGHSPLISKLAQPINIHKIIIMIIIILRSLSAPPQLSPRRVQQTIKQKDAKFQTPKTHTFTCCQLETDLL